MLANLYFSQKDYVNAIAALEQAHPQWKQPIDSINIDALDVWDALNYAGSLKGIHPTKFSRIIFRINTNEHKKK